VHFVEIEFAGNTDNIAGFAYINLEEKDAKERIEKLITVGYFFLKAFVAKAGSNSQQIEYQKIVALFCKPKANKENAELKKIPKEETASLKEIELKNANNIKGLVAINMQKKGESDKEPGSTERIETLLTEDYLPIKLLVMNGASEKAATNYHKFVLILAKY